MNNNKIVDNQGRLIIPVDLAEYANLTSEECAICMKTRSILCIKNIENVKREDMVLAIRSFHDKKRISLPTDFRQSYSKFLVYVQDHELIVEGGN